MGAGDYQAFLKSVALLFEAAIRAEDWKLALQVKTLEAKCRGFLHNKNKEKRKITDLSNEELNEILDSIKDELSVQK